MHSLLFYSDTSSFLDLAGLRAEAAAFIARTPLVQRAVSGERDAAVALHVGFWPFVREFECAIDQRSLPREPLMQRFGHTARRKIVGMAAAVREMKEEEGSHAAHWAKDSRQLGLESLEAPILPEVQALNDLAYVDDLTTFFAMLAGTEFVAEELSRALVNAPAFTRLFAHQRWVWGEIHLAPHEEDGASHLEIDIDLARAYSESPDTHQRITAAIRQTIHAFETASLAVNETIASYRKAA